MRQSQRSDVVQVSLAYEQLMQALTPANRAAEGIATVRADALHRSCEVLHGLPEIFDPMIHQEFDGKIVLFSGTLDVVDLEHIHLGALQEANAAIVPPGSGPAAPDFGTQDMPIFYKTSLASWSDVNWLLMCLSQAADVQPDDLEPRLLDDLIALADRLAAETDCTITVEDPQSRIIAYSAMQDTDDSIRIQSILQRRVPAERVNELQEAGFFECVWESTVPVVRPHVDGRPERLVMGVRLDGLPLGMLWAASERNIFTESTCEALRRCAAEVAPLLMRWKHQTTALSRMRDRAVQALFTSLDDSVRAQSVLGIDSEASYVTMKAFQYQCGSVALPEIVRFYGEQIFPQAIIYAVEDRPEMYIAASSDELGLEAMRQAARKLAREVGRHVHDVKIAIGAPSRSLGKIYLSALSADRVESSLRRSAVRKISGLSVVDETHLVESLEVASLIEGIDGNSSSIAQLLDPLHEHDTVHGSDLVATLSKFFEHFGNVANAAKSLNIHVNTMRYRIKKIQNLVRLDLTDLDTIIAWAVAVRLNQW